MVLLPVRHIRESSSCKIHLTNLNFIDCSSCPAILNKNIRIDRQIDVRV